MRKIIHIDMDAFYASVEQRDNPELRGKPVAVGRKSPRGVVAAASYEARKYGVHSAMASLHAAKLCPHLIFVDARFDAYKEASLIVMSIFREFTDIVEPLSMDEAYLDVTDSKHLSGFASKIAKEIKEKIKERTNLTASAGVSFCKFLAKIASDYKKPDGLFVITPEAALDFIASLDIQKFPGIGKVSSGRLVADGLTTGADLQKLSKNDLTLRYGKMGKMLFNYSRAIDERPVSIFRERKSIGIETTFTSDLITEDELLKELEQLAEKLAGRMKKYDIQGKTVTLKIKYNDFEQHTRGKTFTDYISESNEIYMIAETLFYAPIPPYKSVRLLGLQISNLEDKDKIVEPYQLKIAF